ncbi:response regulator [Marinicauda pacifica]|jgi:DNA-binding response OmpR family regulator|uniref:Response regulator n=2 Tax=Marinicauda pacifica TaxID=1133559 RepID=A0A4S2HAP0_9PROT|nr:MULTISPECIES: response regulator [Marinicauda]TGY92823.1 response regulator [Marinicauda pacifica]GGE40624.1 response regulator [Marinicauda pacifica]
MSNASFERIRILILEDNAHMSTILRKILQGFGVRQVFEARDAADAFEAMRNSNPDLALVDYMLGDVDGLEFTRLVRTASDSPNKYLPIIMVSGHTDRSRIMEAINAGVNEYLAKPVRPVDVYNRLVSLIERPRRFVKATGYFGPDRRRRQDPRYTGPWRRSTDEANQDPADSVDFG